MDIMSLIGLIAAAGLMLYGISDGGSVSNFISPAGAAVTAGGTLAALTVTFSPKVFASAPKLLLKIFLPRIFNYYNPLKYIADIEEIADGAKRRGIVEIEKEISENKYKDALMKKGLLLAADYEEPEYIREVMETDLDYMIERHKAGIRFFEKGALYATGFGMLGTLSGLINMLAAADEPSGITKNMAAALLTTFYGLILANAVFLPLANKLQKRSDDEVLCKQLAIEGVISIANGETPRQIQKKLASYVPPAMRKPG
ncbi:MAG: MotA/TolQ/ExbB proton channel family protein [Oscillospiraceae bacterium]|nr:MotA/TolQ/ExbB proton channel family protein [Oscillospiraceae bacterium]